MTSKKAEELLAILGGFDIDFGEIFYEENNGVSIFFENNKIEKIIPGKEKGIAVRLIKGKSVYFFSTNEFSINNLRKFLKELPYISTSNNKFSLKKKIKKQTPVKINPENVTIEEKVGHIVNSNKMVRSLSPKIKQVMFRYIDNRQKVVILNTLGNFVQDIRTRSRFFINVIAEKDNILQSSYEAEGGCFGFEIFSEHPLEVLAKEAGERVLLMLDAPHAPAGRMPVVLQAEAGGTMIHEACGHALEADFVLKGISIFANRLDQKVASSKITVIDDKTLPNNFGSYNFDDEATPAQKTILIDKGILKGFMTDIYTSRLLNLPLTSNGRRESFKSRPVPRMSNTFIAPGEDDPEAIIGSIDHGLLVKKMGGGEVNVVTGDFVFEVTEGYLIDKGKIKHPVRGAILTGNGPKVLEIIDMVGSDLKFQTGICGKYDHVPVSDGQPTLRIPEIVVGGR